MSRKRYNFLVVFPLAVWGGGVVMQNNVIQVSSKEARLFTAFATAYMYLLFIFCYILLYNFFKHKSNTEKYRFSCRVCAIIGTIFFAIQFISYMGM